MEQLEPQRIHDGSALGIARCRSHPYEYVSALNPMEIDLLKPVPVQ